MTTDMLAALAQFYRAPIGAVQIVDIPACGFLMIDGSGDPNTASEYTHAVEALYALAYGLKFMLKKRDGLDYKVPALEGLWWADDMSRFSVERKGDWRWTMMIAQPDAVTAALLERAVAEALAKQKTAVVRAVRLEIFHEGRVAQTLHLGPYAAEAPTIAALHAFIETSGYRLRGKHHEIYLSDPRRAAPAKLRTVIRQPVAMP